MKQNKDLQKQLNEAQNGGGGNQGDYDEVVNLRIEKHALEQNLKNLKENFQKTIQDVLDMYNRQKDFKAKTIQDWSQKIKETEPDVPKKVAPSKKR